MLRPMPAEDLADIAGKLKLTKGALDLQAAVDTPEAAALRQAIGGLKPDQVMPFMLQQARLGLYLHGTATGYTSAAATRRALLHTRFDYRIQAVPRADDRAGRRGDGRLCPQGRRLFQGQRRPRRQHELAHHRAADRGDAGGERARPGQAQGARQGGLRHGPRGARSSFRGAPEILFVAGAGNEDEDVDFVRSFPAGINLPNVITVGAVDSALQPAGFTSYGKSIDFYANGFEVPAKVPGGMPINISGTSLAAPQVTNLAAKLLAVNPKLTVAQVRAIIEATATEEGPKKLKVINPAAALARARRQAG